MWLQFLRTIRTALKNFRRNGWLAIATISVLTISVFIINLQVTIVGARDLLLNDIKDRVNISVYFTPEASEDNVNRAKEDFGNFQEVERIEHISKDQALEDFKSEYAENEILLKSLEEIGDNPFTATLNIKAHNPRDYELIARMIKESSYQEVIDMVNYDKHRDVINSLGSEINSSRKTAVGLAITLGVVAILITFNTIRLTMYSHSKEIEIMRLVGASNNFIRMPYILEGFFYGLISVAIALPASYFYLKFLTQEGASGTALPFANAVYIQQFLDTIFIDNILYIVPIEIGIGVLLGIVSSFIAIGRYLRDKKRR